MGDDDDQMMMMMMCRRRIADLALPTYTQKPKYLFLSILSLFYYYCVMRFVYKINKTKSIVFNLCNVK